MRMGEYPTGLTHEEVYGEVGMFELFNIDLDPDCRVDDSTQLTLNSEGIRMPLWSVKYNHAAINADMKRQAADHIRPGITTHNAGEGYRTLQSYGTISRISARADDLAKFYAENEKNEISAFFDDED